MKTRSLVIACITLLVTTSAHAIDAHYRRLLERSGCTQVSETQGCDINKTKKENAKAGFVADAPTKPAGTASPTPYAGQWVAKTASGATVATIRIDGKERVWVSGQRVKAKRSDGALVFRADKITYTIQGDRRLKGEDYWSDFAAGTKGPIVAE